MIPLHEMKNKTALILGLGRSGLAVARAMQAGGARALCWDDFPAAQDKAAADGFTLYDAAQKGLDGIDVVVLSPGIAHHYPEPHPVVALAYRRGVPVDNDIGLFFRALSAPWGASLKPPTVIAVTGSNGKSTTAALIHHAARTAGLKSQLGGNIGRGVLDLDATQQTDVIVLELSSFQIELARHLAPDIAVFTNFSTDHLERHGGMGGYFAAKKRLLCEGRAERAIIGVDQLEGQYIANSLAHSPQDECVIRISVAQKGQDLPGWSVSACKGFLSEYRKGQQVAAVDLRDFDALTGAHNHQNACAAYAVLRSLQVAPQKIERGFATFKSLPHRTQRVRRQGGVSYVNDSKATNVDSAAQSLSAFDNILWICGGLQKEGGLEGLKDNLSKVKKAYVIGKKSDDFAAQLDMPYQICGTMQKAVQAAYKDAVAGDTVLLAPAAASLDQYESFEARGDHFIRLVTAL